MDFDDLRKNKEEMLEMNNVIEMKMPFVGLLIHWTWPIKESVSLKKCQCQNSPN
jgi:hypothetical protein